MKRWRRRGSVSADPMMSPGAAPRVVSVVATEGLSSVLVTFDQAVTWDGFSAGTFHLVDLSGEWIEQVSANSLRYDAAGLPPIGWSWDAADTSLSPVPDPTQTGFTS